MSVSRRAAAAPLPPSDLYRNGTGRITADLNLNCISGGRPGRPGGWDACGSVPYVAFLPPAPPPPVAQVAPPTALRPSVLCCPPASHRPTVSSATFSPLSVSSFTLNFTLPDGTVVTTASVGRTSTTTSMQMSFSATSTWLSYIFQSGAFATVNATTGAYSFTLTMYANTSMPAPVSLSFPGSTTPLSPMITVITPATPLASITAASPQCGPASVMQITCAGYQFQNASAPNYPPFPVNAQAATNLVAYVSAYVGQVCPGTYLRL